MAPDELREYRRKRDAKATPEPMGGRKRGRKAPIFVVQRHDARRLHYDFRLERDGALASWAVPKGVPLEPGRQHLAVHVEDHPLEYFDFEGTIPSRQYGGGDVIVWDWGTWAADPSTPHGDEAIRRGELKFELEGEKLQGAFVLLRMRWTDGPKDQWLLIHRRDDHAARGWDAEALPESVKTGRTNEDVAARRKGKRRARGPVAAVA